MPGRRIKVLHLVAGDLTGGAARGAYWLHRGLLTMEVESKVLTDSSHDLGDENVVSLAKTLKGRSLVRLRRLIDHVPVMAYPRRRKMFFSTDFCGYDFTRTKVYDEADIVHLHWINNGLVSTRHLSKVEKPIVWTLRDMWPMTGGCHVTMGCDNYQSICGACPQLGSSHANDLSSRIQRMKVQNIPPSLRVVGISNWISECARKSTVFGAHDITTIFNNIDTQQFYPLDKQATRSSLGLPAGKKIIALGAESVGVYYKGFDKAVEALRYLVKGKYHLCIFGKNFNAGKIADIGFSCSYLGFLEKTDDLQRVYSAADVFLAPSLMEAFGKTIAESMACGTPAVCFDVTGPKDIVDHQVNGYRASPYSAEDLARGVEWVADNPEAKELASKARVKVVSVFDTRVIAKQYKDLYLGLLSDLPIGVTDLKTSGDSLLY